MIVFALISLALVGDEYLPFLLTNSVIVLNNTFIYAGITTTPIFIMIIWLYALVDLFGYGLNGYSFHRSNSLESVLTRYLPNREISGGDYEENRVDL